MTPPTVGAAEAPTAPRLPLALRLAPPVVLGGRRAARLVERHLLGYRRMWPVLVAGIFEPIFFLFSIGVGLSELVGGLPGPDGRLLRYTAFVAPGLLAAAAMNGAILDATFGLFFRLKYNKTFESVLNTPLSVDDIAWGQLSWSLMRGGFYSAIFLVVMAVGGYATSWWTILALPVCLLIGTAFAAVGMAATTFMRSWQDFDFVTLALLPLFLFSATFYPLSTYPGWLQVVVWCTPLFHGVDLVRRLTTGSAVLSWASAVHVAYLTAMVWIGITAARRRLAFLLLK